MSIPSFPRWSASGKVYWKSQEIKAHFLQESASLVTKPYCLEQNGHEYYLVECLFCMIFNDRT